MLLPDPDGALDLTEDRVRRLCDRRAGIGADGVLRVVRSAAAPDAAPMAGEAEWFMDYRNADGSAVEMCGNGIRVFARLLVRDGLAEPGELAIATRDGVKRVRVAGTGDVTVDMGPARLPGTDRKVAVGPAVVAGRRGGRRQPARRRVRRRPGRGGGPGAGSRGRAALPRRGQRGVRRGARPAPRRDARARARGGRDPLLRHRRLRGDGGRGAARRRAPAGGRRSRSRRTSSTCPAGGSPSPSGRTGTSS